MRHASLFTGIGGFDLAAEWMGWNNIFQVEIDPFCNKVLEKNFPSVKRYGDIKQFDGKPYRGAVDILTGGFPCQPYSTAGKRKGTEDDRHLWPEMLRVIGEIQPDFIVGENVSGILNWERGLVFEQIQIDLENQGYEMAPVVLPACGKDAPHRRDRIWIVAHHNSVRFNRKCDEVDTTEAELYALDGVNAVSSTDNLCIGVQRKLSQKIHRLGGIKRRQTFEQLTDSFRRSDSFEPKLCRTLHGIPDGVDRIKSIGNAIVPQVAYEIFKVIEKLSQPPT